MKWSRGWLMVVGLMVLAGCRQAAPGTDAAAPAEPTDTVVAAAPSDVAVAEPEDLVTPRVPMWRSQVRENSLRAGTRLPGDIPFYHLTATIDSEFMVYEGALDLWVKNRADRPWDKLVFHLYPNAPDIAGSLRHLKVTRATVAGKPVEGTDVKVRYELPLEPALPPGEACVVHLDFRGQVKRYNVHDADPTTDMWAILLEMLGGNAGDYGVFGYSSGTLFLSLWYPVLAAWDESGWDVGSPDDMGDFSYFDVSDYLVFLTLDDTYRLTSSGVTFSQDPTAQDPSRTRYMMAAGGVREFTVVAGKDLAQETVTTRSGVTVRASAAAANAETNRRIADATARSVEIFEKAFGPYPYPELDVVQTDLRGGAGGVEFPGLVTIASFLYLDTWRDSSPESRAVLDSRFMREAVEFVVAHEVAHQWWNAVVGSHSRNHPFVDEALANYSAILYFDRRHGPEAARRQRLIELDLPYQLHRLMGGADRPVDLPTSAFTDTMGYSAIVYSKGALYFFELREKLGAAAFDRALARYYDRHRFGIASPGDFQRLLSEETGQPEQVDRIAQRWLRETHADEDIGRFDPAVMVPLVLNELGIELEGWFLSMLGEEGFWELVKLSANIAENKDDIFENIRLDKIADWGARLVRKLMWEAISF